MKGRNTSRIRTIAEFMCWIITVLIWFIEQYRFCIQVRWYEVNEPSHCMLFVTCAVRSHFPFKIMLFKK
jgi:hypothetical protein